MNKYLWTLTLTALLPTGICAQNETELVRERLAVLERVELAKTDREAAATVFTGAGEAAARIMENPRRRGRLPYELGVYFGLHREIMAGEFGPVPDATRDLLAEAFVKLAIAQPDNSHHWHYLVAEAGNAGFERADEALFEIYSALREQKHKRASMIIYAYENRPPEQALPYLSRIATQQDVDAIKALKVMAQAGPKGAEAIMALERAGTVSDYVERTIRWGWDGADEVCPHVPDFTPCVQNAILGSPRGIGTPREFDCQSLSNVREAFPPEEYQAMLRRLCGGND